jgi:AraC-like DNA-binding protein
MSVYWVAFVSESYYLHHRLMGIETVYEWPLTSVPGVNGVFQRFVEFFEEPESKLGRVPKDPPAGLAIQIEGALMMLTGALIEATEHVFRWEDAAGLERLKPAIDFMDEHYRRNPSLSEIAGQIKLAPNYFHRLFKHEAGVTAFKYMENRRLDFARKLLFDQRLNITEVAQETGYQSLYYFSRAFRRRFGLSPSHLRRMPNQPLLKHGD